MSAAVPRRGGENLSGARSAVSVGNALALVLLPKCPLCVGALLGTLGLRGADSLPGLRWLAPALAALLLANLGLVAWHAHARRAWAGPSLAMAGMGLVLVARAVGWGLAATAPAVILVLAGFVLPAIRSGTRGSRATTGRCCGGHGRVEASRP